MMMIIPSRSNNLTTHFPLPLLELMKEINEKTTINLQGRVIHTDKEELKKTLRK